jgi:hypothetical protein
LAVDAIATLDDDDDGDGNVLSMAAPIRLAFASDDTHGMVGVCVCVSNSA